MRVAQRFCRIRERPSRDACGVGRKAQYRHTPPILHEIRLAGLSLTVALPRIFTARPILIVSGPFMKARFESLIVPKVRTHQAFPELAVIGYADVEQFVDNHVILQIPRF